MQTHLLFPGVGVSIVASMPPASVGTIISLAKAAAMRHPLLKPFADKKLCVGEVELRLQDTAGVSGAGDLREAFQILTLRERTP